MRLLLVKEVTMKLQSKSKVLGRLAIFTSLCFSPQPPAPMFYKTEPFERVIILSYSIIEKGDGGYLGEEKNIFIEH